MLGSVILSELSRTLKKIIDKKNIKNTSQKPKMSQIEILHCKIFRKEKIEIPVTTKEV